MKKSIALLFLGILLGSSAAFAASRVFSDVPEDAWYAKAVISLSEKGIVNGYPDGTFGPTATVNRAELAVMLDRMLHYIDANQSSTLSMEEAKTIAQKSACMEEGNLTNEYWHNESTQTWWFDLDAQKPGCNPACVVNEEGQTAEINWMCTGAL